MLKILREAKVEGFEIHSNGGCSPMTTTGPGKFSVISREEITVQIEKSVAPYTVEVSDLSNGTWNPKPENNGGLTAQGAFSCGAAQGNTTTFSILFNFVPSPEANDNPDDSYSVMITGSNGGEYPDMVLGPGFTTRRYQFEVA
jgi:hypothetical protein